MNAEDARKIAKEAVRNSIKIRAILNGIQEAAMLKEMSFKYYDKVNKEEEECLNDMGYTVTVDEFENVTVIYLI